MQSDWSEKSGIGNISPAVRAIRMTCQAWKEILINYYEINDVKVSPFQDDDNKSIMFLISFLETLKNREAFTRFLIDFNGSPLPNPRTHQIYDGKNGLTFSNAHNAVTFLMGFWQNLNYEYSLKLPTPLFVRTHDKNSRIPESALPHINRAFYDGIDYVVPEINQAYQAAAQNHPMFHLTFSPFEIARIYNAELRETTPFVDPQFVAWFH